MSTEEETALEEKMRLEDRREYWCRDPHTRKELRDAISRRTSHLKTLISAAVGSNDPDVRALAARFQEADKFVVVLGGIRFGQEG